MKTETMYLLGGGALLAGVLLLASSKPAAGGAGTTPVQPKKKPGTTPATGTAPTGVPGVPPLGSTAPQPPGQMDPGVSGEIAVLLDPTVHAPAALYAKYAVIAAGTDGKQNPQLVQMLRQREYLAHVAGGRGGIPR